MAKKQSLSDRADMWPTETYNKQINEIPEDVIGKKGTLTYFGSSCHLILLANRRRLLGIKHDENNTVAIENDGFYVNLAKMIADNPAKYNVVGYDNYIKSGAEIGVKFAIRNLPYNNPGQGRTRLWDVLVKADNKHGVLDFQSDILPLGLQRGMDSDLKKMRNIYFDDYGLYKIKSIPFKTFSEWNANVATAMYFCKKGHNGLIDVETSISKYQFDFRKIGIIFTPDTLEEANFMISCYQAESYKFHTVKIKNNLILYNGKTKAVLHKDFSPTKTKTHKYPIVTRLSKESGYQLGYTAEIYDNSIEYDKIVIPYQTTGFAGGDFQLGAVDYVPAGIQLLGNYKYSIVDKNLAPFIKKYLTSNFCNYLLQEWRTSQTNDPPQLNILPKLIDKLNNDNEYFEWMEFQNIKDICNDAYQRKIREINKK